MKMKILFVKFILWLLSFQSNPSILPWAFKQINRLFKEDPETYLKLLQSWVDHDNWLYRFFVAHQLGSIYTYNTEKVLNYLKKLSNDENDLVLEGAAHSWSDALDSEFETVFGHLKDLRKNGSYQERRTAALGPVEYYRDSSPAADEMQQIENFWKTYKDDPKQGLSNLVRTQIMERYVNDE